MGFRLLVDQVVVDPTGEGGFEVVGLEGCGGYVGVDVEHPVELGHGEVVPDGDDGGDGGVFG